MVQTNVGDECLQVVSKTVFADVPPVGRGTRTQDHLEMSTPFVSYLYVEITVSVYFAGCDVVSENCAGRLDVSISCLDISGRTPRMSILVKEHIPPARVPLSLGVSSRVPTEPAAVGGGWGVKGEAEVFAVLSAVLISACTDNPSCVAMPLVVFDGKCIFTL